MLYTLGLIFILVTTLRRKTFYTYFYRRENRGFKSPLCIARR